MDWLRELLRWPHIVFGFTGLVAFWFPVFARKGGPLHRRAGKIFLWCGYGVCLTSAASCVFIATMLASAEDTAKHRGDLALIAFLGYLAWVTYIILRHSVRVLEKQPAKIDTPLDRGLAVAAIAASLLIIAFALLWPTHMTPVLLALSPIGLSTGWGIRRYLAGADPSPRAWFYEHMGATLGAGIAFHTAFLVFGMRRFVELPDAGWLSILPWVLPAAIGIPGTALWQRHYRLKFDDLPAKANRESSLSPPPVQEVK